MIWVALSPPFNDHELRELGGPGSGNFGHAGRPGSVGGSAPRSDSYTISHSFSDDEDEYTHAPGLYIPGEVGGSGEAFETWFAGSTIVKDDGSPKTLYRYQRGDGDIHPFAHVGTRNQAAGLYDARADRRETVSGSVLMPIHVSMKNPLRVEDDGSLTVQSIAEQVAPEIAQQYKAALNTEHRKINAAAEKELKKLQKGYAGGYYEKDRVWDNAAREYQRFRDHELPLKFSPILRDHLEKRGYDGLVYHNTRELNNPSVSGKTFSDVPVAERQYADSYIILRPEQVRPTYKFRAEQMYALGGPGSGNFGHAGRPGSVGGSAPHAKFGLSVHHSSALQAPVRLYHNSPDLFVDDKPAFDAYFGDEEFLKAFPNEWGAHTYAVELPVGTRVLDLSKDSPAAREFKAKMAKANWPDDTEAQDLARAGELEPDHVYEMWTDKRTVRTALDQTPGYDVVKYEAEWVIPKEILSKLSGEKIKTAAAMLRALSRVDALEVDIMLPWPDWSEAEWESRLADAREVAVRRALGGPGSGNFGHAGRPGSVGGSAPSGGLRIIGRQDDVLKIQHSMAQVPDVVRKLSETRTVEVVPKRSMEDRMREYMAKHYQMTDAEFDAQFPKGKKPNGLVDRTRDHVLTTDPETFINQQLRHTMPRLEKSFARLKREGLLKGVDPFTMFSYPSPVIDIMEWSNPLVGIINIPPVKEKLHEWGVM